MKEIKLTQGKVALVDDENFDYLNQWNWFAMKHRYTFYAVMHPKRTIKYVQTSILMHRMILNLTNYKIQVDHKDQNGLNNCKTNLRRVSNGQNQMNKRSSGVSKYLGVSYDHKKYIKAAIRTNGNITQLGYFKTEEEAAKAYDKAAKEQHGEFANLNFKTR